MADVDFVAIAHELPGSAHLVAPAPDVKIATHDAENLSCIDNPHAQDVVEAPDMRDRTVKLGTCVFFEIDPVASVADFHDATATAAAALLQRGRFLLFISRYHITNHLAYTEPLGFTMLAVGHGFPEGDPAFASIALSPNAPHPAGRAPMLPSVALPWKDCYIHALIECNAIVTRIHLSPPGHVPAMLPVLPVWNLVAKCRAELEQSQEEFGSDSDSDSEEPCELEGSSDSDDGDGRSCESQLEPDLAHRESNASGNVPSSVLSSSVSVGANGLEDSIPSLPPRPAPRAYRSQTQSIAGSADSLSDATGSLELPEWTNPEHEGRMRIRGKIWLDLTSFDDFARPEQMKDLFKSLKAIEEEWTNRMAVQRLTDQQRTRQWAREVAGAGMETEGTQSESKKPADAVEHRMEGQLAD